jgi:hypothetical protein
MIVNRSTPSVTPSSPPDRKPASTSDETSDVVRQTGTTGAAFEVRRPTQVDPMETVARGSFQVMNFGREGQILAE